MPILDDFHTTVGQLRATVTTLQAQQAGVEAAAPRTAGDQAGAVYLIEANRSLAALIEELDGATGALERMDARLS